MNNKKKIYYVYFLNDKKKNENIFYKKRDIVVEEDKKGECNGLRVFIRSEGKAALSDKKIKKLVRILKDYDISETVVIADKELADVLDISDMLFMARKNELINNCSFIMTKINEKFQKTDTAVIVIGSGKWNVKDIYSILNVVKNYYKKIDIVMEYQMSGITNLVELAYDEWGVVLHVYSLRNYPGDEKDLAIFLLRRWRQFLERKVPFEAAYIVTDDDSSIIKNEVANESNRWIFGGLRYASDARIDDVICTQMAWQKPVLYEKFHVSVIDICELQ